MMQTMVEKMNKLLLISLMLMAIAYPVEARISDPYSGITYSGNLNNYLVTPTGETADTLANWITRAQKGCIDPSDPPYAAVGNGSTDDTAVFNAILALNKPICLNHDGKKYALSNVALVDYASIWGNHAPTYYNPDDTQIVPTATATQVFNNNGVNGVYLGGLAIQCAGYNTNADAISTGGVSPTIENMWIGGCHRGIGTSTLSTYTHTARIINSTFMSNTTAIDNLIDSDVIGGVVAYSYGNGIVLRSGANSNRIALDKLEWNGSTAGAAGIYVKDSRDITISIGNGDANYGPAVLLETTATTGSTASNINITGGSYLRNGRYNTADHQAHFRMVGNVSNVTISGITTAHGTGDAGAAPDTPLYGIDFASNATGSPSNIRLAGAGLLGTTGTGNAALNNASIVTGLVTVGTGEATDRLSSRVLIGTSTDDGVSALQVQGVAAFSTPLPVVSGGTGTTSLTGYVKGTGTPALTASTTIPTTDLVGVSGTQGWIKYRQIISGNVYNIGPPFDAQTTTNTNTLASDTLYVTAAIAPAPFDATAVHVRTSSSNVSVGAKFLVCLYGPNSDGKPGSLIGQKSTDTLITDTATAAVFSATLDSVAHIPHGLYYGGLIATTSVTAARFALHNSAGPFNLFTGATNASNLFSGTPILGYSVSAPYTSGCPDPFGTATAVTGVSVLPYMAITAQ